MIHLDSVHVGLIVGMVGKLFISICDTMPAPPANANYFWKWGYDLAQDLATNSGKKGARKAVDGPWKGIDSPNTTGIDSK